MSIRILFDNVENFYAKVGIGLIIACLLNVFACFTLLFKSWNKGIENKVCSPLQVNQAQFQGHVPYNNMRVAANKPSVCQACGYDTAINPLYCGNCGGSVNKPLDNSQVCKNCGAIVPGVHKYCHNCRAQLK